MANELDAGKAATLVKKHAVGLHGNLADFSFKLTSVKPNSKNDVWYVDCEYFASVSDKTPSAYRFKVNTATGQIESITKG